MTMEIDINADLGEGFGVYKMGEDEAMMEIISSANIACGFHAGDPLIMQKTLAKAKELGIDAGAHPGFPDLVGFGRRRMMIDHKELAATVIYQLAAISGMANMIDHPIKLMSFHGAMGNMVAEDPEMADHLIREVAAFNRELLIRATASPGMQRAADKYGMQIDPIFAADRAYEDDGELVSRKLPGSLILDHHLVMERVKQFLQEGTVRTYHGNTIKVKAHSILVHGDNAESVQLAKTIRRAVEEAGGRVVPASKIKR